MKRRRHKMTRRLGCPVTHTQTLASLISNKDRYSALGLLDAMTARRARPNRGGFARFGNRPNRRDFSRGRGPGGLRTRTPAAGRGPLDDHDRAAPGPDRLGDEYGTVSESYPSRQAERVAGRRRQGWGGGGGPHPKRAGDSDNPGWRLGQSGPATRTLRGGDSDDTYWPRAGETLKCRLHCRRLRPRKT